MYSTAASTVFFPLQLPQELWNLLFSVLGKWCLLAWCHSHLTHWTHFFHCNIPWFGSTKTWRKNVRNQATLQIALLPPSLRCSLLCPENMVDFVCSLKPSWLLQDALGINSHCRCKMFASLLYIHICFNMFQPFWHPIINGYPRSVKQLPSFPSCSVNKLRFHDKSKQQEFLWIATLHVSINLYKGACFSEGISESLKKYLTEKIHHFNEQIPKELCFLFLEASMFRQPRSG